MNLSRRLWPLIIGVLVFFTICSVPPNAKACPSSSSFTFAFAGDFYHSQHFSANLDSLNHSSVAFFLALGDLAYGPNSTTLEQNWCSQFKVSFDNVEIVTGNHDSGESRFGSILKYVQYCPWTLSGIPLVPAVDLVINAHVHMYARSKQLICATYNSFSSSCVVDNGGSLTKGMGTVMVTGGTGGADLDNMDPAKTQNAEYFATTNNNTWGYSEV